MYYKIPSLIHLFNLQLVLVPVSGEKGKQAASSRQAAGCLLDATCSPFSLVFNLETPSGRVNLALQVLSKYSRAEHESDSERIISQILFFFCSTYSTCLLEVLKGTRVDGYTGVLKSYSFKRSLFVLRVFFSYVRRWVSGHSFFGNPHPKKKKICIRRRSACNCKRRNADYDNEIMTLL